MKSALATIGAVLIALLVAIFAYAPPTQAQDVPVQTFLPMIGNNAYPQNLEVGASGYMDRQVNLDIYGFRATYLIIFTPNESSVYREICWYGTYASGAGGARCDGYVDVQDAEAWQ